MDQSQQIRNYVLRTKQSMNDVMVAATLLMLNDCVMSQNIRDNFNTQAYFNVLNPVDMRSWADRRSPASNRVGFAYIRRRPIDCADPADLVDSVAAQLRYVRTRGVGAELMKGWELLEKVPLVLNRIEHSERFTPTVTITCLSNLQIGGRHGVTRQASDWMLAGAKVDHVRCIAPRPPGVPLAIAVVDTHQNLSITMRGVSTHFDPSRLQTFGDSFCQGCRTICQ